MTRTAALPWDDLQVFIAVAHRGSVTRAAGYLGVNHSTVLRRIDALERRLGTRLFERLREGYALTTAGNELARQMHGLQEQVDGAHRHALGVEEEIQGSIKITASDVVLECLLMPALAAFRARHPLVRIELVSSYGFAALASDEADLAIRGADKAPSELVGRHVGDIETVLCAAAHYLDAHGRDRPLAEHRWVLLDETLAFARMKRWAARHVPGDRVVARVDSLVGVADAIHAGLGIGWIPRPLARGHRDLVELAPPLPEFRKPIWVLMHPEVRHVARMQALFKHLVDALGHSPNLAHAPARPARKRQRAR